jgi:DNA-binding response OmpR family regulator
MPAGANGFLPKPFTMEELIFAVGEFLPDRAPELIL